jgi:hypothetical protein
MKEIDLAFRTLFVELSQRSLDASFQSDFPIDGRFVTVPVKGRNYWYFDRRDGEKTVRKYVGPHGDPDLDRRVAAFQEIKDDLKARRKLVATLTRDAGFPAPERVTGDVVEALAAAGFFRLRGVLVGTVAFQCYSGLLGVRLPASSMQTGDADFAQFHSVSAAVGDSLPPLLDLLRGVDATFREIPHQSDGRRSTAFQNASRYRVEFLTPNRGSAENDGRPADMPALGGASAEPLRFLDFLIHEPRRSVMLHRSGVVVTVPAPERYAVHKLIVAVRRRADDLSAMKRDKDVRQADLLVEALGMARHQADLATVYAEAWRRGAGWREALAAGMGYLTRPRAELARDILAEGLKQIGEKPDDFGLLGTAAGSAPGSRRSR